MKNCTKPRPTRRNCGMARKQCNRSHVTFRPCPTPPTRIREGGPREATPINFSMAKATRSFVIEKVRSYFAVQLYNER